MPSVLEQAAASARSLTLGGRTYTARPITIGDLAAFRQRIRAEALNTALEAHRADWEALAARVRALLVAGGPEPAAEIRELHRALTAAASAERLRLHQEILLAPISRALEASETGSITGTLLFLTRAISAVNPGVTEDEIATAIGTDIDAAERELMKLLPAEAPEPGDAEPDPTRAPASGDR